MENEPVLTEASAISEEILRKWESKGVSRRDFIKFCTAMTATLALPLTFVPQVAAALEDKRLPVIWVEYQSCSGDSEAFLRSNQPTAAEIILDVISLEYSEIVMAAAGHQAEKSKWDAMEKYKGKYLLIVEGAIPTGDGGVYCTVGGESAVESAKKLIQNAAATITVGTCASYGGIPAAKPNPTTAVGVRDLVPGAAIVNLPGCPVNADNLTATLVHFLTFGKLPAVDAIGRPKFAYGKRIHDNCERRAHFDAGQYAESFGDAGHRQGHCLYKLGCKGPEAFHNCPTVRYNEGLSWPVMAGHGCIACASPGFWDTMSPFYRRLPQVPGFGVETTADKIGLGLVGATAAAFAVHGVASAFRKDDAMESDKVKKEE
jgi:hydrogenase small subunit